MTSSGETDADFNLGDARLNRRAAFVWQRLTQTQGGALPAAFPDDAEIEGTYRFLQNDSVTPSELLAPHQRQTLQRMKRGRGVLLAVHDGTELKFGGDYLREGLSLLSNGTQGFTAHVSLLCSVEGDRRQVHGVLNIQAGFSDEVRRDGYVDPWGRGAEAVEEQLGEGKVIHVIDREADSYLLQAHLQSAGARYVIRAKHNRRATDDSGEPLKILDALRSVGEVVFCRAVPVSARHPAERVTKSPGGRVPLKGASFRRTPVNKRSHPSRQERTAKLHVTAASYRIRRPNFVEAEKCASDLCINVVRVYEKQPPEGCAPVEWILATNEPIDTAEDLERVVDAYRARWIIEEYFKALKTGCGFEKLQLEQRRSLLNALALYASVAWRLLHLRQSATDAESAAHADAAVLTTTQTKLLRALRPKLKLPPNPTASESMLAVASLGGHIKNNGTPGWLVLGRGMAKLLEAELGYLAAAAEM